MVLQLLMLSKETHATLGFEICQVTSMIAMLRTISNMNRKFLMIVMFGLVG